MFGLISTSTIELLIVLKEKCKRGDKRLSSDNSHVTASYASASERMGAVYEEVDLKTV